MILKPLIGALVGSAAMLASTVELPSPAVNNHFSVSPPHPIEIRLASSTLSLAQEEATKSSSSTENYLPRLIYPGTYGEFCGPTPEIKITQSCAVHGWHADKPKDRVDETCRVHDISYCQCETDLLVRQSSSSSSPSSSSLQDIPMLSSMTALRFATKPALARTLPVDKDFFDCINKADKELVTSGIKVRSEMQRNGCSVDPSLSWLCDIGKGTLEAFEKVSLQIFLRDLDYDIHESGGSYNERRLSLTELEKKRQLDLQTAVKSGKSLSDAASSELVQEDEQRLLERVQRSPKVLVQSYAP